MQALPVHPLAASPIARFTEHNTNIECKAVYAPFGRSIEMRPYEAASFFGGVAGLRKEVMNTVITGLTEWLADNSIEWTTDDDGAIEFKLSWGTSHYACTFGAKEATLMMEIKWLGTFGPALTTAAPIMTELATSANKGQVWLSRRLGSAMFKCGVRFVAGEEHNAAMVDRVLRVTFDVFNLMILATQEVIAGVMTLQQAVASYEATLFKMYGTSDDVYIGVEDDQPIDSTPAASDRYWRGFLPYQKDDTDPTLN